MRLRLELFVDDLDVSIAFYRDLLGFHVARRAGDYASLRRGPVVLGLGPVAKLPAAGSGPGFTRAKLAGDRGAGVEIVLELDDPAVVSAAFDQCRASGATVELLRLQPWGLWDFRLADPDGYYLRVTHGDAATAP
jgi:lactoylglutathione lyase